MLFGELDITMQNLGFGWQLFWDGSVFFSDARLPVDRNDEL